MNSRQRMPRYWILYLFFGITAGLFVAEARAALTPALHEAAQFGVQLLFFVLLAGWLRVESVALIHQTQHDVAAEHGSTYRFIVAHESMTVGSQATPYRTGVEAESVYAQLFKRPVEVLDPDGERNN